MFFGMRLWILLLPEKDFLAKNKIETSITLCYFNLLDLCVAHLTLKLTLK